MISKDEMVATTVKECVSKPSIATPLMKNFRLLTGLELPEGTGKEPTFYDSDNFFIVYLPNLNYQKDSGQINDQINDPISDVGLEILKIIQNNPGISVNGVFKILKELNGKVTLDIIRNSIKRELYNLIEHRGSKKTGGYYTKTNVKWKLVVK